LNDFLQYCIGIFILLLGFGCIGVPAAVVMYLMFSGKKASLLNVSFDGGDTNGKRKRNLDEPSEDWPDRSDK
jgi:hypothetical protein